jgi:hypothetical protein
MRSLIVLLTILSCQKGIGFSASTNTTTATNNNGGGGGEPPISSNTVTQEFIIQNGNINQKHIYTVLLDHSESMCDDKDNAKQYIQKFLNEYLPSLSPQIDWVVRFVYSANNDFTGTCAGTSNQNRPLGMIGSAIPTTQSLTKTLFTTSPETFSDTYSGAFEKIILCSCGAVESGSAAFYASIKDLKAGRIFAGQENLLSDWAGAVHIVLNITDEADQSNPNKYYMLKDLLDNRLPGSNVIVKLATGDERVVALSERYGQFFQGNTLSSTPTNLEEAQYSLDQFNSLLPETRIVWINFIKDTNINGILGQGAYIELANITGGQTYSLNSLQNINAINTGLGAAINPYATGFTLNNTLLGGDSSNIVSVQVVQGSQTTTLAPSNYTYYPSTNTFKIEPMSLFSGASKVIITYKK